jgi:uncharacterized protein YggE
MLVIKSVLHSVSYLIIASTIVAGQEAGNRTYGTTRRKPAVNTGVLTATFDGKSQIYFVEANVLMNVKADAFVAVFAVVAEAPTSAESNAKTDATISSFIKDLGGLEIKPGDIFVDFINQNKIYDYTTSGNVVSEKFSGFETKKNVAVRYNGRRSLDKILAAAGRSSIFDLIEVKYVVGDVPGIHARLYDEAVKVIKQKQAAYEGAFGVKLSATNVANEKYDSFYPGDLYSGYQAFETGNTYGDYNNRVVQQRKTRTFFYDPASDSDFDSVINQMGIEPMVQFTLYVKMQFELGVRK